MGPCPPPRPHRTSGPGCPPDAAPSAGHGTGPPISPNPLGAQAAALSAGKGACPCRRCRGCPWGPYYCDRPGPARPAPGVCTLPPRRAGRSPVPHYLAPHSWGLPPWTNAAAVADEPSMPAAHSSQAGVLRGSPRFANCYRSHRQPLRRGSRTGRPGRGARSLANPPPGPAPRTPARARSLAPRRQAPLHARPDHGAPKNVHWLPSLQVPPPPRVHWRPAARPRPTHAATAHAHWRTRRRTPPQTSRLPAPRRTFIGSPASRPRPPARAHWSLTVGPRPTASSRHALIGTPASGLALRKHRPHRAFIGAPAARPRPKHCPGTRSLAPLQYTSPASDARSLEFLLQAPGPRTPPRLALIGIHAARPRPPTPRRARPLVHVWRPPLRAARAVVGGKPPRLARDWATSRGRRPPTGTVPASAPSVQMDACGKPVPGETGYLDGCGLGPALSLQPGEAGALGCTGGGRRCRKRRLLASGY